MQAILDEIIEQTANLTTEEQQKLVGFLQEKLNNPKMNGEKKNPSPNIEWLKKHRGEVAGKYVALENGNLVGQGRTIREADQEAKRNGANKPLLTYVADEDEEIWGGW